MHPHNDPHFAELNDATAWKTYAPQFSLADEYQRNGLVVIPNVIPAAEVAQWTSTAQRLCEARGDHRTIENLDGQNEQYGRIQGVTVEGDAITQYWPEMTGLYRGLAGAVRAVTGVPIQLSPYPRSWSVIRQYIGKGSEVGWHLDTNGVTGLLFLTTHTEESGQGALSYIPPMYGKDESQERYIWPVAGSFLIMDGRRVYHRVKPLVDDVTERITVPLNYYVEGELWRPEGLDDIT